MKPLILIGASSHAAVVIELCRLVGRPILGALSPDLPTGTTIADGVPILGDDLALHGYSSSDVELVNAIGSTATTHLRGDLYRRMRGDGYRFATLCHPSSRVSPSARLGEGCLLLVGTIVSGSSHLGENVLLNSGAIVDHNCRIGDHCHIATGATLAGGITLGRGVHVGAGATLIQGITIGDATTVGAGAVVIGDAPDHTTVVGVPAREIE